MYRSAISSTVAALAFSACAFGFTGGGLPPDIRTVAVIPFENDTSDPTIAQQVNLAVREAMQRRLGLRSAAESQADAVVRGRVTRYQPDEPLAFAGTPSADPSRQSNTVQVTRRQVQVTIDVEIVEQKSGRSLWQRRALLRNGEYEPGRESEGRRKALELLITDIVNGAQSQW